MLLYDTPHELRTYPQHPSQLQPKPWCVSQAVSNVDSDDDGDDDDSDDDGDDDDDDNENYVDFSCPIGRQIDHDDSIVKKPAKRAKVPTASSLRKVVQSALTPI